MANVQPTSSRSNPTHGVLEGVNGITQQGHLSYAQFPFINLDMARQFAQQFASSQSVYNNLMATCAISQE